MMGKVLLGLFVFIIISGVEIIILKIRRANKKELNHLDLRSTAFFQLVRKPINLKPNQPKILKPLANKIGQHHEKNETVESLPNYPTALQIDQWVAQIKQIRPAKTDVHSRSNQSDEQLFDGFIRDLQLIRQADWKNISLSPIEHEQLSVTIDWLNHYHELERPELMRLKNNLDRLQQKVYYFQHNHSEEFSPYAPKTQIVSQDINEKKQESVHNQLLHQTVHPISFNRKNRRELIMAHEILNEPVSRRNSLK